MTKTLKCWTPFHDICTHWSYEYPFLLLSNNRRKYLYTFLRSVVRVYDKKDRFWSTTWAFSKPKNGNEDIAEVVASRSAPSHPHSQYLLLCFWIKLHKGGIGTPKRRQHTSSPVNVQGKAVTTVSMIHDRNQFLLQFSYSTFKSSGSNLLDSVL